MAWPKSIRWRYSLRALLVFIALFAVWCGYHSERSYRERKAAEVLRARGARFVFHHGRDWDKSLWNILRSAYPKLIETTWRDRYITSVRVVTTLDGEVAQAISQLPHVESVTIESSPTRAPGRSLSAGNLVVPSVEPGVVRTLVSGRQLRGVGLICFSLSDADCRALAEHRDFEGFSFHHCQIPENGFARLFALPRLRRVFMEDCSPTGSELTQIPGSASLEDLHIQSTPVGSRTSFKTCHC